MISVHEAFVDADRQVRLSDRRYQTDKTVGEIYNTCRKDYGKCVSRLFIDTPDGDVVQCGWCFRKPVCADGVSYQQEVWVQLYKDDNQPVDLRIRRDKKPYVPRYLQHLLTPKE